MTYQNLTTDKTQNPSLLITLLHGLLLKIYNLQDNFCLGTYENWQVVCQMENKTQSKKKTRSSYSPGPLSPKIQNPFLKYMVRDYPHVKYLGIIFDSKFTFQKHLEEILGRCSTRYHRIRLLVSKKWGPNPSAILQIYKQCVSPIFEHNSLSTMETLDTIISKIQRIQNKLIRFALRLPNYISVKLLHELSGLPYVKDRLLSCVTRTLERTEP